VAIPAPASNASSIPPQLALALGEGPLGGVRGQATYSNPAPDFGTAGTNAGSLLAFVTTPLLAPVVNNSGGDDALPADPLTALVRTAPQLVPGTAGNLVVPDVSWVFTQPAALARVVLSGGVETIEGFDGWLASLAQPTPSAPTPAPTGSAEEPGQTASEPVTVTADLRTADSSWTEVLGYRPLWWSATAGLSIIWFALNVQKWVVARRGQKPQLQDLVK
jgi:hypothetical protein